MRTLSRLLLAVAFAVGASAQAGAAVITITGGALGISIGALPQIQFGCGGSNPDGTPILPCPSPTLITVPDPGTGKVGFVEPASLFTGEIALPTALFTGVALINGLTIGNLANGTKTINAAGAIAGPRPVNVLRPVGAPGVLGGPGPLTGTAFVNVLGLFNLAVPLNPIGNTGVSVAVVAGTLAVTVQGTGWTTGNITLTNVTTGDPAVNTVVRTGADGRNANGTGIVQLISAFHVTTNAAGNLPGLATQTLTFVPEPGTLLLLCSGVATLGIGGWLRARQK